MTRRAMIAALGALLLAPLATHARAEVSELRMATQFGIGAMPMILMQKNQILEKPNSEFHLSIVRWIDR